MKKYDGDGDGDCDGNGIISKSVFENHSWNHGCIS